MILKAILKSNYYVTIASLFLAMAGLIALEILFKYMVVFFDQPWPTSISMENTFSQGGLTLILFISVITMVSNNLAIFSQFNIPRKDQFRGNFLTIFSVAILALVIFQMIYPLALHLLFEEVIPLKDIHFINNVFGNNLLNWLKRLIELISAGTSGYFLAMFIKRFSVKWFFFALGVFIIAVPILLAVMSLFVPKEILNPILEFFQTLEKRPVLYFANQILEIVITLGLIKLLHRGLSIK